MPGHPLHSEGEYDRQHSGKTLGHGGNSQGHTDKKYVDDVAGLLDVRREENRPDDDDCDDDHGDAEHPADAVDLALQGCALLLCLTKQPGDVAHFRAHAGGRDHRPPAAAGDRGSVEHHVDPVADPSELCERGGLLEHGLALTGQRRLGDRQRRGLDQATVGRDRIALGEQQHVAGHDVDRRHLLLRPVSHHRRRRRGHPLQSGDRLFGARFLDIAEHGVEHDDHDDDDDLERDLLRALDDPGDEGHDDGAEQEVDERVGELGDELAPGRNGRRSVELVRPEALQASGGFGGGQAGRGVGVEVGGDVIGIATPRFHDHRRQSGNWPKGLSG